MWRACPKAPITESRQVHCPQRRWWPGILCPNHVLIILCCLPGTKIPGDYDPVTNQFVPNFKEVLHSWHEAGSYSLKVKKTSWTLHRVVFCTKADTDIPLVLEWNDGSTPARVSSNWGWAAGKVAAPHQSHPLGRELRAAFDVSPILCVLLGCRRGRLLHLVSCLDVPGSVVQRFCGPKAAGSRDWGRRDEVWGLEDAAPYDERYQPSDLLHMFRTGSRPAHALPHAPTRGGGPADFAHAAAKGCGRGGQNQDAREAGVDVENPHNGQGETVQTNGAEPGDAAWGVWAQQRGRASASASEW